MREVRGSRRQKALLLSTAHNEGGKNGRVVTLCMYEVINSN